MITEKEVPVGTTRLGDDGVLRTWNGRFWMCPEDVGCDYCNIWRSLHQIQQEAS